MVTRVPALTLDPAAGAVIEDVGATASAEADALDEPALQRSWLHAHVGEQVDRRLLHSYIRGGAAAIVVRVETPGPLHRPGAEDQCAARGAIQGQRVRDRSGAVGRAPVEQRTAVGPRRRRQTHQAGGPESVVDVAVPFVAERAGRERGGGARCQRRDRRVAPEANLAERRRHRDRRGIAVIDLKSVPVSAFCGRPPSAGGLNLGSRPRAGPDRRVGGSILALALVSL